MLATTVLVGPVGAAEERYQLGAQDRIRLKVTEWRAARGETYAWEPLSGEFTVDAGGKLALPLVGELAVGGLTTGEAGSLISERLQQKVGLTARPDASVEVAQFRPIYVVGRVDKPGAYPYRPNLTVVQAVSLAGGYFRTRDMDVQRLTRDAISARGELRDVMVERSALMARRARLEAEMRDEPAIRFPDAVTSQRAVPAVADAMREEQALFETRRTTLRSQVDALTQAKALIDAEIETLQAKIVSQDRQLGLARKELDSINALMQRGLTISPRQLALEQTVAQMESARLDNVLAISRSRQDVSRNDRTILDLKNQRQNTVLADLREAQMRLAKLQEKAETVRALIVDSEVTAPQALTSRLAAERSAPVYAVVRQGPGGPSEIAVAETDAIQPGDVLKVEKGNPDDAPQKPRAAAPAPGTVALAR
ncbi:polysaccharide biosynthesis/export family protein [Methylobacterium crusticola]|uniref:polysaccharide biosynthesis/export family protein n=1 Tax=Methylobacterium crusticola TaxID=1697972 RepID=UPI00139676A7|nr:polysaccharide biosynthesis/export family protein [Methylobacterium crusticola]